MARGWQDFLIQYLLGILHLIFFCTTPKGTSKTFNVNSLYPFVHISLSSINLSLFYKYLSLSSIYLYLSAMYLSTSLGAWIAEWSSHSTMEIWNIMPCAVRSIHGDNYSFSAQVKHLSSTFREDRVKEAEKQLLILLFVKKLLKFVLFYESVLKITKMENISLYLLSIYIFYLPIYIFSVPVFLLSKSLTSLFLCFFSGSNLSKFLF